MLDVCHKGHLHAKYKQTLPTIKEVMPLFRAYDAMLKEPVFRNDETLNNLQYHPYENCFPKTLKNKIQLTITQNIDCSNIYEICVKMLPYPIHFNMCLTIILLKEPN
jgi:hypothetical protein